MKAINPILVMVLLLIAILKPQVHGLNQSTLGIILIPKKLKYAHWLPRWQVSVFRYDRVMSISPKIIEVLRRKEQ